MVNTVKEFLIVDLETTSLDVAKAEIKVFGAYDPIANQYFIYKWSDYALARVMELFSEYKVLITFNGLKYDLPILSKHGVPTANYQQIDVYDIFKNKRTTLLPPFEKYSLKELVLKLGLDEKAKGDIDYGIFKKDKWNISEQEEIITYLKQDLLSTWKLWSYLINRFKTLAKYVSDKDAQEYKHITTSLTTYAYKALCKLSNMQELYDHRPRKIEYSTPIITFPRKSEVKESVALFYIDGFYTHTAIQYNLLSENCTCCLGNEGKYHGKNYHTIKGFYCQKNLGRIERVLKKLYAENDADSKSIRNIIESQLYNILTNGMYYSTYSPVIAKDLLALIKQQIKTIFKMFGEAGYFVITIDLNKIFIIDKYNDTRRLVNTADKIVEFLQSKMSMPTNTFKMRLIHMLRYTSFMRQVPGSEKNFFMVKGQYAYITEDGSIGSKGVNAEELNILLRPYYE